MSENPRPPDWENPYPDIADGDEFSCPIAYEKGADTIYPFAFEQGKVAAISEVLTNDKLVYMGTGSEMCFALETSAGMQERIWEAKEPGYLCFIPLKLKE